MIILQKLKWSDCFSYGADNELDLNESPLTQIIGFNGTGKSSIPLIIEEVLYNKNSKGIKKADIQNRTTKSGYWINLTFTNNEVQYEIDVTRKGATSKVKLFENGDDISSHTATNTYKSILGIIGIDFKVFGQLVYQNVNNSLQFLTATDANRKKFLIDLFNLSAYIDLFETFKNASRDIQMVITGATSKVDTIQNWLDSNKLSDTTILIPLDFEINTDEDEKLLRSLSVELENISEKNKKILANNSNKEALKAVDMEKANKISASQVISYDYLQKEEGNCGSNIHSAKTMLNKLKSLGDECPTCLQSIDETFKQELIQIEHDVLNTNEERLNDEITPEIDRIKQNNRDYKTKVLIETNWQNLFKAVDNTLPSALLDRVELDSSIQRIQGRIQDAKAELATISRENERRTKHNTRIQVIEEQTEQFQTDLKAANAILDTEQELLNNLEILKKAFSTNGLVAYKIENLVKDLEDLVNKYLAELSAGRFTLQFVVSNDKLNVELTDEGFLIDITPLSSGEVAMINTATLLAIRKLMSSISKSRLNILFLDEVINVLDEAGREKLVEILLGEPELNTYVVSHGWTHPLLDKINIVRKGNYSVLEK
jgi:DNA repair exonuclease SbcCD ATPase subunit